MIVYEWEDGFSIKPGTRARFRAGVASRSDGEATGVFLRPWEKKAAHRAAQEGRGLPYWWQLWFQLDPGTHIAADPHRVLISRESIIEIIQEQPKATRRRRRQKEDGV